MSIKSVLRAINAPPKCVCGGYHVVEPEQYNRCAMEAYDRMSPEEQESLLVSWGKPPRKIESPERTS